jgi:putative phage-type endonuclease
MITSQFLEITQNSQEWLAWRNGKIGASDLPIILGISPYCSPLNLWKRMLGFSPPQEETLHMTMGKMMEPVLCNELNAMTQSNFEPKCSVHKEISWAIASLDGVDEFKKIVLEIKCNSVDKHLLAKQNRVPMIHWPQVQWQLFVTGYQTGWYLSYSNGDKVIVEFSRDDAYINDTLIPAATEFYRRLVDYDPPPEQENDYIEITDPEFEVTANQWKTLNARIKELQEQEKQVRKTLIEFTDDGNCQGFGLKLSRIERKGTIDWDKCYKEICEKYPEVSASIDPEKYRKEQIGYWKIEEMVK